MANRKSRILLNLLRLGYPPDQARDQALNIRVAKYRRKRYASDAAFREREKKRSLEYHRRMRMENLEAEVLRLGKFTAESGTKLEAKLIELFGKLKTEGHAVQFERAFEDLSQRDCLQGVPGESQ